MLYYSIWALTCEPVAQATNVLWRKNVPMDLSGALLSSVFSTLSGTKVFRSVHAFLLSIAHHLVMPAVKMRAGALVGDITATKSIRGGHGMAHVSRGKEDKGEGDMEPTGLVSACELKGARRDDGADVSP
ncbi:hypothetical protein U9M48_006974, partial [Paspalum notatum var. saurae]